MVLCHSMKAGLVMGMPWGGGDTQTLPYSKKKVWVFCTQRQWGHKNFWYECSCNLSGPSRFHQLFFVHSICRRKSPNKPDTFLRNPRSSTELGWRWTNDIFYAIWHFNSAHYVSTSFDKNIFLLFVGRHTFPLVPGKGNATVELRVMDLDTEQLSEERIVTYINHVSQLYNIT